MKGALHDPFIEHLKKYFFLCYVDAVITFIILRSFGNRAEIKNLFSPRESTLDQNHSYETLKIGAYTSTQCPCKKSFATALMYLAIYCHTSYVSIYLVIIGGILSGLFDICAVQ